MKPLSDEFIIYTDGGARGNPGPSALGVVIQDTSGHIVKEYSEAIGTATNNVAEYRAIIFALKKLKQFLGSARAQSALLEMRMDSELVARQLNAQYKIREKDLMPLFIEIWNARQDFGGIRFVHVRREENKAADKLVNAALDQEENTLGI